MHGPPTWSKPIERRDLLACLFVFSSSFSTSPSFFLPFVGRCLSLSFGLSVFFTLLALFWLVGWCCLVLLLLPHTWSALGAHAWVSRPVWPTLVTYSHSRRSVLHGIPMQRRPKRYWVYVCVRGPFSPCSILTLPQCSTVTLDGADSKRWHALPNRPRLGKRWTLKEDVRSKMRKGNGARLTKMGQIQSASSTS